MTWTCWNRCTFSASLRQPVKRSQVSFVSAQPLYYTSFSSKSCKLNQSCKIIGPICRVWPPRKQWNICYYWGCGMSQHMFCYANPVLTFCFKHQQQIPPELSRCNKHAAWTTSRTWMYCFFCSDYIVICVLLQPFMIITTATNNEVLRICAILTSTTNL